MELPSIQLRLLHGVGVIVFGTLQCERRVAGALLQVAQSDAAIHDAVVQGSVQDCCHAALQILQCASAAHSPKHDSSNVRQPMWQYEGSDAVLTPQQLCSLAQEAPGALQCYHTPSACCMPLQLAAQCCQVMFQGLQAAPEPVVNSSPVLDYEDQDGDVVMADEEVEQLISCLQAARHDSSSWDAAADHATISMLLFGHQAGAQQQPTAMDFAIRRPGAVRLFVTVDTSVLLSHWSFIQALHRNLGQDGVVAGVKGGDPGVQLLLVVPWAVLVELDKLKEQKSVLRIQGGKKDVAGLARRAIKGLGTLLTHHACLQYQSEADAAKANKQFGQTGKKVLNDDSIIHCGMDVQFRMHEGHSQGDEVASHSGAVLLTRDNNMCLKAQANNLKALTPKEFPAAQPHLYKQLFSLSSDTSPVKHSPHAQATPPDPTSSPLGRPPGLGTDPPKAMLKLFQDAALPESPSAFINQQARNAANLQLLQAGHTSSSSSSSGIAALAQGLSHAHLANPLSMPHASQQAANTQRQQQQQQQQQPNKDSVFTMQSSPQAKSQAASGKNAGKNGYSKAPFSNSSGQSGKRQGKKSAAQALLESHFGSSGNSSQVQSASLQGSTSQKQSSNGGRGAAASMGNKPQPAQSASAVNAATGAAEPMPVLSGEDVRDLGGRVWGVLTEGLQPFMQWDLQSSLGDLWKEVVLRAPPWDAADMLAVLKKNMSFSQQNNAPLWRSHAEIQTALKAKHQPKSLSAVTDLASHVSSLLLALPLPSKTDQEAHTKQAAVTGLEARQALQQARNEIQSLLKTARSAVQQPASSAQAQHSSAVTLSSALDPIVDSRHLNNGRQPVQLSGLNNGAETSGASNAQASQHMWQQHHGQQPQVASAASGMPFNHWQTASSIMSQAQEPGSRFNASSGFHAAATAHAPSGFISSNNISQGYGQQSGMPGLDVLGSGQGLLRCFGQLAAEHLVSTERKLQHHGSNQHTQQQAIAAIQSISDVAKLLLHAIAVVQQTNEPSQHMMEVIHHCAQNMLALVYSISHQQQSAPSVSPKLVNDLHQFFAERETAQLAANVAQQLQQTVQSTAAAMQRF